MRIRKLLEKNTGVEIRDLTHRFHEKYRASGIALCVSLAALAASESWWFYGFLNEVIKSQDSCQKILYGLVLLTALVALFLSFYIQYMHYLGMWNMARNYALLVEKPSSEEAAKHWTGGNKIFSRADTWVTRVMWIALINFLAVIVYIIIFRPGIS